MTIEHDFTEKVEAFKKSIQELNDVSNGEEIEQTAKRLEGVFYAPPIVLPVATFLRLTKQSLLEEIEKLLALPDAEACALAPDDSKKCQDLRLQFISVLIYHYKKLLRLRAGDADEWDEIDEQYIHD